ncbi:MAG: DUF2169 domain-containing protein, partial [Desulfobacteraceae bacterium]|nr:DUF2169 domain-containing protein [Desulfobacteraceae bacterium]
MENYRPLQLSFNHQVLEQNRKFYFTASATLGINLQTGEELLDLNYLKDVFECMGENPLPDMGMPKPNGEFLVSGSYFAPGHQFVTGGEVKVRLGEKEKNLYVFGPRKWQAGLPSTPEKITSMIIDYTKAFGGDGYEKNPDGIGFNDGLLPCIEDPQHLVASKNDKPFPTGFSPLYPMLPQRMKYQGTYNSDYKKKYFPGYPEDHDWKFFLCSASDQWITDFYRGDESFSLYNMHPEIPLIQGSLPGLYARCFINQKKQGQELFGELPLNLDTIWFFPEKVLALLVFRGVTEVEDDEAEEITHVLSAYEDKAQQHRSLEYYKEAFEKRKNGNDDLLKNLNTQDLIPEGHKTAMAILMDTALDENMDSGEFAKNMDAKADEMQKMADEKIEDAIQSVEKNLKDIDIPDDAWEHLSDDAKKHIPGKQGGFDLRKLMKEKSDALPDPDVEKFNAKLESAMPGIMSGDPKKIDMKDFSFDKTDEIYDAVDELVEKKKKDVKDVVDKEIDKAAKQIKEQAKNIDKQIEEAKKATSQESSDLLENLEETKIKITQSLEALDTLDLDSSETKKGPLPRVDTDAIIEQLDTTQASIDPMMMDAMQHVQAMKIAGEKEETIEAMEKGIKEQLEASQKHIGESLKQAEEQIQEAEQDFKKSYILGAHFMEEGLSPHKLALDKVKTKFLEAISNKEDVSNGDWACIDLEGENLDGINLSGAFLEQVNFKGASLRGTDLFGAILSRAILEDADFTGANLQEANIGAVKGHKTNFTKANLKFAKLSKADFTGADFTKADLEDIESLELIISDADFTQANIPKVNFIETSITGAIFHDTDMNTSAFIKCSIDYSDFSESFMDKSSFVDTSIKNCKFNKTKLSNACFVATDPENVTMENLDFSNACLNQANFQSLVMKNIVFSYATMENAFFAGANLSGADLTHVQA